jgi:hypothetical protein
MFVHFFDNFKIWPYRKYVFYQRLIFCLHGKFLGKLNLDEKAVKNLKMEFVICHCVLNEQLSQVLVADLLLLI